MLMPDSPIQHAPEGTEVSTQGFLLVGTTTATLDMFNGKQFQWNSIAGLAAVWFACADNIITIGGWQCKCSDYSVQLTYGSLRTSRSAIAGNNGELTAAGAADQSIQDLPVTAETGFLKIATALQKTFPEIRSIKLGTLLITTTRNGRYSALSLEKKNNNHFINRTWFRRCTASLVWSGWLRACLLVRHTGPKQCLVM
jgi:hypothetical protein